MEVSYNIIQKIKSFLDKPYSAYLILGLVTLGIYYKFFIFGKIPFPGDLLVVSYSPWLDYYKFPVQNPLISDVFSQFFLWKHLAIDAFKNLEWPLWNPYSFTGNPLLATYHSAVLYPLNILLFLPKNYGWGFYIYSQTIIASITFYLFISQIVKSKIAGLSGAVIFSLGGLMTTWLELGTAGHAIAWLPLVLYSIRKFILVSQFKFIPLLIASLSLVILAGNAQITTYTFFIAFLYILFIFLKNKVSRGQIFILFFSLIASIGITALQVLPSYDLLQKSIRQTESYTAESNFGLLNTKDSLKFFIPDYFGNAVTRNYWGTLNYSETSGFLGIVTLPLLLYLLFRVRSKEALFFSILFLFTLLFSFNNPISNSFYNLRIPLLTSSYGSRMLFITLLSTAILASLVMDHIKENKSLFFIQKAILWSWAAILGVIIGTLLTFYSIWNIIINAPNEEFLKVYLESNDYALQNFLIAAKNSLVPFSLLTFLLLFMYILNKTKSQLLKKYKLNILLISLFVLLVLDLGRYFLKFNPFISNNLIFPTTPSLEFLQKQKGLFRVGREHAEVLPPNTWIAYKLQTYEGYDPIYLNQYGKFMRFLNGGDIRTGSSTRYAEVASNYSSSYLDAVNTRYLIAILRDDKGQIPGDLLNYKLKESNYKLVFKDKSSAVLENPNSLDRVYLAKKIQTVSTQNIENILMNDKYFDPRVMVFLSEDLKVSKVSGTGKASIIHYSPGTVKIKTDTPSDEVLILADQYEEGWKAKIDGKETPISPANLIFRAIKIPAGSHEVVFRYRPKSFDIGLKISQTSLLLLMVISLLTIKTKRF